MNHYNTLKPSVLDTILTGSFYFETTIIPILFKLCTSSPHPCNSLIIFISCDHSYLDFSTVQAVIFLESLLRCLLNVDGWIEIWLLWPYVVGEHSFEVMGLPNHGILSSNWRPKCIDQFLPWTLERCICARLIHFIYHNVCQKLVSYSMLLYLE